MLEYMNNASKKSNHAYNNDDIRETPPLMRFVDRRVVYYARDINNSLNSLRGYDVPIFLDLMSDHLNRLT